MAGPGRRHLMPHAEPQPPRRGAGELEAAVLSVLWQAGAPELSYSTVVTILSRLHAKKALERWRDGRAFRYAPVADEAGLAARRLAAMLARFVADLSESDEALLRRVLADDGAQAG